LTMQESLGQMNAARAARGEPPLRMGVGLHSGPVVLGDIGAPARREYTAVGNTVNVAARIEELTKAHGFAVLVSDETRRLAGEAFPFEAVAPRRARLRARSRAGRGPPGGGAPRVGGGPPARGGGQGGADPLLDAPV